MTETTTAFLTRDGGWGAWVKVSIAPTAAADKAGADFFRRVSTLETRHAAHIDEEGTTYLGPEMSDVFFPMCEHQMSAHSCYGPDHFMSAEQERLAFG